MDPFENLRNVASQIIGSLLQDQIDAFKKHFEKQQKQFNRIAQTFEKYPDSMDQLANHGWYTTLESTPGQTNYLENEIYKKHWRKVDKYMMELLQADLNRIKSNLIKRHPIRSKILR